MVRIFVDPQPFAPRAESFWGVPDRPRTVCSRYRSHSAITVASAIRSVPLRALLTQRPLPDEGEVGVAGICKTDAALVDARRRNGRFKDISKAGALIATATAAELAITGELSLKENTS